MKYRKSLPIDGSVAINKLIRKIKEIEGVEKVRLNNSELIIDSNLPISDDTLFDLLNKKEETYKEDVFYFDYIDCPNCASKIEYALNKSKLIKQANLIFLSNKIIVKHNENDIFDEVEKIVKSLEKDTNVFRSLSEMEKGISKEKEIGDHEHDEAVKQKSKENKWDFVRKIAFIVGCVLFVIASIYYILGSKELLDLVNLSPLVEGYGYIIPVYTLYITSYILLAYDLINKSIYGIINKDYFNESLLMVIASIGAIILSFIGDIELFEACAVVLLYKIGESLQDKATEKSKEAIKGLLDIEINKVMTIEGKVINIDECKIGEQIIVKVGEKIPLDGIIVGSNTSLDMKALTGESEPIFVKEGDTVLSGSVNLSNVIKMKVTTKNNESTIAKVKKIVEEANEKKSHSEQFITKFARVYTPIVLSIAVIILIIQLILKVNPQEAFNNVFAILVISCPCSLVISIPLAYFASIGSASKNGILVKGGNYLEALTNIEKIVFDKTGTITKGDFEIVSINPYGISEEELIRIASLVESCSNHPIAKSIIKYSKINAKLENVIVEEFAGLGIKMTGDFGEYLVGNEQLMINNNIDYVACSEIGSIIYVSDNKKFVGSIVIRDQIRKESKNVISLLKQNNIETLMLTGDKKVFGEYVANEVGITKVYSQLLPQDKYEIMNKLLEEKKENIVYVGDGINDTPSLRRADVGIAIGGIGSDLAKEAADIVIMNDNIEKVYDIIHLSKFTKKVIIQNVIFILLTKLIAIVISVSGILSSYAMLIAIFADVGVCLICILNSLRILKKKN